jgi:hypothetical protein
MTAEDLLTLGRFDEWARVLLANVQALGKPAGPAAHEVVLYSVAKLAAVCDVDVATVRRWLKTGKEGKNGQPIKLQAFHFTSEPRIPWPALLAYERGEAFDLATLPAPVLSAPEAIAPAPVPQEATRMRLAS